MMAEAKVSVNLEELQCSICLDLLTDPVSINCGHSFCNRCLQLKWNTDANTGLYFCPLCRQKFSSRPRLGRNIILAEMVERMKKMSLQTLDRQLAGPDDEKCNVCTGEKYKAIKTCTVCVASYCNIHLNLHDELNPGNKHRVINVTGKLQDKICSYHNKLKDVYCCDDKKSVCVECIAHGHAGHRITSNQDARYQQSRLHENVRMTIKQRIQETEEALKTIQEAKEEFKSTLALEKDIDETFEDLMNLIRRQQTVVDNTVSVRKQKESQRTEGMQTQLQMTFTQLKQREEELHQLSSAEDDIYYLQLYEVSEFQPPPKVTVDSSIFEDGNRFMSNFKARVEQLSKQAMKTANTDIPLVQTSTPTIREDFLKYFQPLTVDPNTVHKNLKLKVKVKAHTVVK